MPSNTRRALLAGSGALLAALCGCSAPQSSPSQTGDANPHWVTVYLGERDETHHVTVTITNESGEVLFEKEYQLSDSNETGEDGRFPTSTDPDSIAITVDGTQFERDWPGFEQSTLPCNDPNEAGIQVYVENDQDGQPDIRLEADCQSVTGA